MIRSLILKNGINKFVTLVNSNNDSIVHQSLWVIGNIAG